MGDPAGSGKQYCTSCGELIDRESVHCTYCGAEIEQRAFPDERSGPATASEGSSVQNLAHGNSTQDGWSDGQTLDTSGGGGNRTTESRSESPLRTILASAGLGAAGIILLIIISAIVGLPLSALNVSDIALLGITTTFGQYIGFVGLSVWYLGRRGFNKDGILSYLGVRRPSLKEIGLVVLGWITIFVLIIILGHIVQEFLPEPAQNEGASQFAESSTELWALGIGVLFMFLVVGPCEEVLFRGIVQNRLRERLSVVPAILLASAIFASIHVIALAGNPAAMATTIGVLFVPAIVLGAVYEYTGNVVVSALLHGLHNSVILTVIILGPETQESAAFLATVVSLLP
ncbi:type II CAAX prenyl endopeptidase Rce1 family protein [Halovenus rubra]|uniref:Type II CAAX prenyl endopeptidase Rce1 family protein n=2 Tax=Halovenus rubra TaxID=869890 RepID=A0ABD5X468_9EURY|nr:CPBP family glutamic-type intramembrane protease [Halovenus rubra]